MSEKFIAFLVMGAVAYISLSATKEDTGVWCESTQDFTNKDFLSWEHEELCKAYKELRESYLQAVNDYDLPVELPPDFLDESSR